MEILPSKVTSNEAFNSVRIFVPDVAQSIGRGFDIILMAEESEISVFRISMRRKSQQEQAVHPHLNQPSWGRLLCLKAV